MKIGEKEIIFGKYTHKIDRTYNELLVVGVNIKTNNEDQEFEGKYMQNLGNANDYLVLSMTNLLQEEIDDLSVNKFNEVFTEVIKLKENTPTKA